MNIFSFLFVLSATAAVAAGSAMGQPAAGAAVGVLLFYLAFSPRVVKEWEKGVLLRLGRFQRIVEPGITWLIPGVDTITDRVDLRIRSTPFSAERTLTRDTVPVNVDAVLFWEVADAKRSVLGVEDYLQTITWAAQTTLRDVIGRTELVRMISDRETLDRELESTIGEKARGWGIIIHSVEIRDLILPGALEDAMSRQAQADREKEARIILAESELKVADLMQTAAKTYQNDALAMQLRAMNMTYESIKERGALMIIPSNMSTSFDPVSFAANSFRPPTDES